MLSQEEREDLLRRARAAIASSLGIEKPAADPPLTGPSRLAGAFVTLREHDELRGCIGYPEGDRPLVEVIEQCAVSASMADPRFPSLDPAEFPVVVLEISVLGPIEPVADISEIEIGRHGLIIQLGPRRGLLLPQVATELGWDRETFVTHTCLKAGLARDAWQTGARVFKFEAEVFSEKVR